MRKVASVESLFDLFQSPLWNAPKLLTAANVQHIVSARPLHMCSMGRKRKEGINGKRIN